MPSFTTTMRSSSFPPACSIFITLSLIIPLRDSFISILLSVRASVSLPSCQVLLPP